MRFSVKKENIVDELQLLQGIVEKRNTMPILANILVSVFKDRVELIGTDLEVGLRTSFDAQIEETGAVTVSGKKLFEIVKSLTDEQSVTFKENEDLMMEITSGASEFRVLCLPKEDFPLVPEAKFEKNIYLPFSVLKEMINRVYYAIAQEQRYYLNGALLVLKNREMELVSTDGHRLSYTSYFLDNLQLDQEIRVIVARKTLNELRKIEDERIEFDADENNLFFKIKNKILISRIIESKFPNFEAVIPKENPNKLSLPREDFASAIKRVALLSTERSKGIKFFITKNELRLFSSNPEIGEARDRLGVDYAGQDLEIGFNSQYLLDFLNVVSSERIRFELKDDNSSALMLPESEEEMTFKYVLMPMKI